jgi:hypothetical protein
VDAVRAALATAEEPRHEAWASLQNGWRLTRDRPVDYARLLPQLMHAAELAGTSVIPDFRSVLRAARVHEELRVQAMGPVCRDALEGANGERIVLRGVALSHTVYDHPAFRHCHDLDLLVPRAARSATHPSGLPVSQHTALFGSIRATAGWAEVEPEAVVAEVAGVPARILAPADALVHICVHAATNGVPHSPMWCVDAALVLRRYPDLDWDRVVQRARQWRVALHTFRTLRWLRARLAVPVRASALARLLPPSVTEDPARFRRRLRRSVGGHA